ncbi:MAG: phage antirepressor N-terminal domain-containing protein [Candidatus Magnetobacterium sp. LHC-1]|nr:phage antirepressor N-terminal domain-containing protein [Nitrospirota bacterium]
MHTQNLPAVRQITFHEDTLTAIEQDSKIYVAMKPICEALGLDWRSQRTKIHVDEILSKGVVVTTTPSPGGPQETTFLELKKFHGWLFKISTRRVKNPLTRAKLIRYQEECYDVLYEHFSGKTADKPYDYVIPLGKQKLAFNKTAFTMFLMILIDYTDDSINLGAMAKYLLSHDIKKAIINKEITICA